MKPKLSNFSIVDFAIINSSLAFNPIENEQELQSAINSYEIDIDFAIMNHGEDVYKVLIKASVNNVESNIKPGYSIFAEAICLFKILDKSLLEKKNEQLLQINGVMIAINTLRGFIASLSAGAPYGRYILPVFDISDLFAQKNKIIDDLKSTKLNKTKDKGVKK